MDTVFQIFMEDILTDGYNLLQTLHCLKNLMG